MNVGAVAVGVGGGGGGGSGEERKGGMVRVGDGLNTHKIVS
jgi:hypothetical protein